MRDSFLRSVGRALAIAWCWTVAGNSAAAHQAGTQQAARWTISAHPQVAIGEALGPDEVTFQAVAAAHFLPDGRIVVADDRALDIRVFGSDGKFQARFGRQGRGPEEFSYMTGMWVTAHGKIAIWDATLRRITLLNSNAVVESTHVIRPTPSGGNLQQFLGSFGNDDIALGSLYWGKTGPGLPPLAADRIEIARFSLTGEYKGQLGEAEGLRRFNRHLVPFSPVAAAVIVRDSMYITDSYEAEIVVRDSRGVPRRTIVLPPVKTVSADAAWSFLEKELRRKKNTLFIQYLEQNRVPKGAAVPQLGGIIADDQGYIWVKEYDPYNDAVWFKVNMTWIGQGGQWRVIQPDGRLVAVVRVPDGLRPLEIKGNRLLGLATDSLDVQRIVVHTIQR